MNFLTIFISNNGSFGCPGICSKNDTILKKNYLWETSTSKKLDKLNINTEYNKASGMGYGSMENHET